MPEITKTSLWEKVKDILSIAFALILLIAGYLAYDNYYYKTTPPIDAKQAEIDLYKQQALILQKHLIMNDSILLHFVNENKNLKIKYDSIQKLKSSNAPTKLPIFK